jgi:ribosomal protein L16
MHRMTLAPVTFKKFAGQVEPGAWGLKAVGAHRPASRCDRGLTVVVVFFAESGQLTYRQLEATRRTIRHVLERRGRLLCRVGPDIPITAKAVGVRLGNGKGPVSYYVAQVEAGKVIFELRNTDKELAQAALSKAQCKLPVKTIVIPHRPS